MIPLNRTVSYHPDADPMDVAAEEFVTRFRNGERPSVDEYVARHPELADDIRKLFPMLVALEECGSTAEGNKGTIGVGRQPGERVGGFTLVRRIGEGGMGVVFEAVQDSLGRPVAIKFLKGVGSGRVARERFQREVQAIARLHHSNVVAVYGSGEHDGLPYYAMQLVRGRGLDSHLDERRATDKLPTADDLRLAVGLTTQVADALAYAHRQGVIHRDIKPSNLLVDEADRVWVADFGLAHIDGDQHLTATGGIVGTRQYMAPEQYNGWADPRSDVYALGVTLYELTTGTAAFDAATPQEVLHKVMTADVAPPRKRNPLIHPDLETVILKAMASEPAHRYPTAAAFADDLRLLAEGKPVSARRLSNTAKVMRWAKRNPMAAGLATAVVLLMTVVTVLSAWAALRFNRLKNEAETARGTIETQRDTIGRQLDEKEKAETESNALLSRFLLRTAQAQMAGRNSGKREALAALAEAAALSRRLDLPADYRNTLRREYIAALAMSDLAVSPDRTWELPGIKPNTPIAFSPCGKLFAIADSRGRISLRSADGSADIRRLPGPQGEKNPPEVFSILFSRSGQLIAARQGSSVRVWRVKDGQLLGEYGSAVESHEGFDLLADDSGVVWAEGGYGFRIRRFAQAVDAQVVSLPVKPSILRCDPTGQRIAFAGPQAWAVFLFDIATGTHTRCLLPRSVDRLAWAPDGNMFAAAGESQEAVYVVSVRTPNAPPLEIGGHNSRVVQLAFHPNEDLLATCGWDQTVRVWDLNRPSVPVHVRHSLSYRTLSFSADGRWLGPGVTDGHLWAWEWVSPTAGQVVVQSQLGVLHGAALSSDGKTLVGFGGGGLEAWEVARPRRPIASFPVVPQTPEDVSNLAVFGLKWQPADGDAQALLNKKWFRPLPVLSGRRVWFSADGRELTFGAMGGLTSMTVHTDSPSTFRLTDRRTRPEFGGYEHIPSPDGRLMAILPSNGPLAVYEVDSGKPVAAFARPGGTGNPVFSPDSRWLASGAWPETGVKVWDLQARKTVANLSTTTSSAATFSPDGKWLVVGTGDGYQFYRAGDWQPAHRIPRTDCGHFPCSAAFTPDGKTVALWTKPGQLSLLNPADGTEYAVLPVTARTGSVDANGELQFTHGGKTLTVAANQKQIQMWDIAELRKQLAAVGLDWTAPE